MDVIGVGITENADREKLEKMTGVIRDDDTGRDGDGSGIGSNGGSSHMIIPQPGESLDERIEEALAIKVAEGEIIDKIVGNMYIICISYGYCTIHILKDHDMHLIMLYK